MADIVVSDLADVRERARTFALPDIAALALLPDGFERPVVSDILINGEAATLRKLFAEAGLHVQVVSPVEGPAVIVRKSADLVLPVLFVGASVWSQNPIAVQVAMNVISSYVFDALKGLRASGTVKLSVAVESKGKRTMKLLTYEGPADGLEKVTGMIERIANEQ